MVDAVRGDAVRRHQGREAQPEEAARRAPFTTSTLQQEAAKKLGFSPGAPCARRRTCTRASTSARTAPVGLITYMRTDSVRVSDQAVASVRDFIGSSYGKPYLPDAPNAYSDRRRTPGSRTRTRRSGPTDVRRRPEQVQRYLEPDQFRLYQLIWQRFVASQMTPAVYDMTIVDFDLGQYLFRATGSVIELRRLPRPLHRGARDGGGQDDGRSRRRFRRSPQGDAVEVREITPSQHFTEPPPRFSEASLVKELERLGIGRPSTYSAIISTLAAREYVKVEQRRFFPTELGEMVEKIMVGKFPEIFNVEFTSEMENELDRIEEGELGWQRVLQDFYGPFTKALEAVDMNALVADAHGLSARGPGQGALPQVRLADRAQDRALRSVPRLREVQGHLRLREVAQEGARRPTGPPTRSAISAARRW